jgi:hypothetical protein
MEELPNEFVCPITQEMMKDPVFATDGHTYERLAIEKWFQTNYSNLRSPMSNETLESSTLTPNRALKKLIDRYRDKVDKELLHLCLVGPNSTSQLEELIERGARPNIRDEKGNSLVMLLLAHDQPGCIKAMVRLGASVLHRNDLGLTLLDMARNKVPRDETIVNMIHKIELEEKARTEKERKQDQARRTREANNANATNNNNNNNNNNRWNNVRNWFRFGRGNANANGGVGGGGGFNFVGGFPFIFIGSGFGGGSMMMMLPMIIIGLYFLWNNSHLVDAARENFNQRTLYDKVILIGMIAVLIYFAASYVL